MENNEKILTVHDRKPFEY